MNNPHDPDQRRGPELHITPQPTEAPPQDQVVAKGVTDTPVQATERHTDTDQKQTLVSGDGNSAGPMPGTVPTIGSGSRGPVELRGQIAHFRVLETLGSGGFGTVLRAYDTQLDREVAVKIIRSRSLGSQQITRQFQEEARAAAQLRHPNIVTVHQSGVYSDDQVYIVYDYIRGLTLREMFRQRRPLPLREAVSIMLRIARALGYAHARGIVHRDVKPENVLIEAETDEPHVADFGCARRTAWQADESGTPRQARANNFVGTPVYFSPEQASGRSETAGAPADVWALGVMLDELITGERSFLEYESNRARLMNAIQFAEPIPIRQRAPRADRDLAAIWAHCLCKDPAQRYASAAELADDLENWQRGLPVSVRPLSVLERFGRWGKRNPGIAASLAAVFLAVSLGFAVSSFYYRRELLSKKDNVENSIDRLFSEPTDGVASIMKSLQQPYLRDVSQDSLREHWQSLQAESGTEAEHKKLRIALAEYSLLDGVGDDGNSRAVRQELLASIYRVPPEELALLLEYLPFREHPQDVRRLQEVADNPLEGSGPRLRAICVLANTEGDRLPLETRQRFAEKAAQFLQSELGQNMDLTKWVPLLSPLRNELQEPLETALSTGQKSVGKLLYHFYRDDEDFLIGKLPLAADDVMPDLLSNLSICWQKQSPPSIWRRLQRHAVEFAERLSGPLYSRAVARLWLAGLHATDAKFREPIPALNDQQDPSIAAYVSSRAYGYNVQLARLMAMLRASLERHELTAARHYLLAISKYPPESELEQLKTLLLDCYQHSDSGLHATADWMMRKWRIDHDQPTADLNTHAKDRNWRVGPANLLMIRCPVPKVAFKMGSTLEELALARVENRSRRVGDSDVYHQRVIPWQFEVSATEVTSGEFLKFLNARVAELEDQLAAAERDQQEAEIERLEDSLSNLDTMRLKVAESQADHPMTSVSWYDAVAYCTWLSRQEGLGSCYGTIEQIEQARQKLKDVEWDVRQSGYRLPLVAEWECMCRANSTTVWSCGNDESLLSEYSIFRANSNDRLWQVASLAPNRWGLFDTLGNASEWTSNAIRPYPLHQKTPYVERLVHEVQAGQQQLGIEVRGGSYAQTADAVRSAHREASVANNAAVEIGFRIARTIDAAP